MGSIGDGSVLRLGADPWGRSRLGPCGRRGARCERGESFPAWARAQWLGGRRLSCTCGTDRDVTNAARLAKSLGGHVFGLLVHDDDVFVYDYYQSGRLVDQFNSKPDYFEPVSARQKAKYQGHPERFAELAADQSRFDDLRTRLADTEGVIFASELLAAFADSLGISNATTSYEYLHENEETDDIEGLEAFVHIPDLAAENVAKRRAGELLRGRTEDLKGQGVLLCERGGIAQNLGGPSPNVAPDREGSGFLVAWTSALHQPEARSKIERIGPPWAAAVETDPSMRPTVYRMALSPSGRFLATGHAAGDWKARAWDLELGCQVAEATHTSAVVAVGFTALETAMVSASAEVVLTPLVEGGPHTTWPSPQTKTAVVHPREPVCVVADNQCRISLLDLTDGRVDRTLFAGGLRVPSPLEVASMASIEQQMRLIDVDAMEKQLRAQQESMFRTFANLPLPPGVESADKLREQIQAQFDEQIGRMKETQKNPAIMTAGARLERGSEIVFRLAFDSEGRRLFAGTSGGVRVYDWAEVTRAERDTPRPLVAVDLHPWVEETPDGPSQREGYVYDVAHDPARDRLVFGGLDGRLRYLDLASGQSGVLLDPPGRPPIHAFCLSRDRTALAVVVDPDMFSRASRKRGPIAQFWNYPALCERAIRMTPEN